jgi:hypothetical protein
MLQFGRSIAKESRPVTTLVGPEQRERVTDPFLAAI